MNIHLSLQHMRNRDEIKEKNIRQKALKMIVEKGFDGFSMQKLAKAADVSPATLYIYFKDKEDLILQISAEESEKMLTASLKDFHPESSFKIGLKVQWMNRALYCIKHPLEMEFLERIRHSPFQERSSKLTNDRFKSAMNIFVHNAIEKKQLVKVPMEVFWSIAYSPLYTLVRFHQAGKSIGGKQFTFSEKTMLKTLDLVLKALKP